MSENRIPGAALIRPPRRTAAGDGFHMAIFCSALGNHQIVKSIPFIKMGPLWILSTGPIPHRLRFRQKLSRLQIQNALTNSLALWPVKGAQQIHSPVIIKKQGRVNSLLAHPNRVRPFSSDIVCPHIKIPFAAHIGCHHIETAFMVTNGRSPNSLGWLAASQRQLGFPVQHTADLFPMDQVIAVKQGNAGKKLKGAGHKIIIVSHPADAGIGIKPGNNRIIIFHFLSSFCSHISVIKTSEAA